MKRFGIHPIIFNRVFTKLKADNKKDRLTTILFLLVIVVSSTLIMRSTFEILHSKAEIQKFIENDWNKIFHLYLLNTVDLDEEKNLATMKKEEVPARVVALLDSLNSLKTCSITEGFYVFPDIVSLKSKDAVLPKIQCFLFGKDNTEVIYNLQQTFHDTHIVEKPYIFLQHSVARQLKVHNNDIVLAKLAGEGSMYSLPLYVKVIEQETRYKCFVLQNYLQRGRDDQKNVRFYFSDYNRALSFMLDELTLKWRIDYPIYIGAQDLVFGSLKEKENINQDFLLRTGYIEDKYGVAFSENVHLQCNNGHETCSLGLSNSPGEPLILYKDDYIAMLRSMHYSHHDTLHFSSDLVLKNPHETPFFVEIDFNKNFRELNNRMAFQEALYEYIPCCDSVSIHFDPEPVRREQAYAIMYYNNFDNQVLNRTILEEFDNFNIRWDNGKWKTIIELHESLKKGEQQVKWLMGINFFIFVFFLIAKFHLKLKLEFHTIGTIRCFGFSMKEISRNYRIGFSLLVFVGFVVSVVMSPLIAMIFKTPVNQFFADFATLIVSPINYVSAYFIALLLTTNIVIWLILRNLIKDDNIYELIKYEG